MMSRKKKCSYYPEGRDSRSILLSVRQVRFRSAAFAIATRVLSLLIFTVPWLPRPFQFSELELPDATCFRSTVCGAMH